MKKFLLSALYAAYISVLVFVPIALGDSRAASGEAAVEVPILMYHAVVPDDVAPNKYAIRVKDLAADLDFLIKNGYSAVDSYDLINFKNGGELPEKCVMLTFDDGFYSMLEVAEILKARGMKAVCAVVGAYDGLNKDKDGCVYKYLDFDDVKTLSKSGVFEIASHTFDMHSLKKRQGASKMKGETEDAYERAFKSDISRLSEKLSEYGIRPVALAYPYGLSSKNSDKYLSELGIEVSYSCSEGVNRLKRSSSLYALKRVNRSGTGAGAEQILKRLETAA